jgi:hypothetical protein
VPLVPFNPMNQTMQNIPDRFLWQSKINYIKGITPSNPLDYEKEDYIQMVEIGKEYFIQGKSLEFCYFFRESQYFISLWAAHILLEYGQPDNEMKKDCIEIIKAYCDFPMNERISKEENEWVKNNLKYFSQH